MKPQYIRCMINSPYRYYDSETGTYDKTRNIASISRLLRYCTERGITVMYGEYNPPTWDMKQDQKWVDMSVDYLNYLVNDLGFSCIKYFVIFNEPDGNWASTNGDYEMWKQMLFRFHRKMKEYPGLTEKVMLAGPDVVADYKNEASAYDAEGWVKQTALDADSIIGLSMLIRVRMKCVPDNIMKFFPAINIMFPRGKRLFWVRPVISIGVMLILC